MASRTTPRGVGIDATGMIEVTAASPGAFADDVADAVAGRSHETLLRRLQALERVVGQIEEELADEDLDDEQRLQNIGERLAALRDG